MRYLILLLLITSNALADSVSFDCWIDQSVNIAQMQEDISVSSGAIADHAREGRLFYAAISEMDSLNWAQVTVTVEAGRSILRKQGCFETFPSKKLSKATWLAIEDGGLWNEWKDGRKREIILEPGRHRLLVAFDKSMGKPPVLLLRFTDQWKVRDEKVSRSTNPGPVARRYRRLGGPTEGDPPH